MVHHCRMILAQTPSSPPTTMVIVLAIGIVVVINGILIAAVLKQMRHTEGPVKYAWWVPVLPVMYIATRNAVDLLQDPDAHAWWPVEFFFVGIPCAMLWSVMWFLTRKYAKTPEK